MSDFNFHFHLPEGRLMSLLNQILAEVESIKTVTADERAQVKAALDELIAKVADLEAALESVEPIDIELIKSAVADIKADVAAVYEPETPIE